MKNLKKQIWIKIWEKKTNFDKNVEKKKQILIKMSKKKTNFDKILKKQIFRKPLEEIYTQGMWPGEKYFQFFFVLVVLKIKL